MTISDMYNLKIPHIIVTHDSIQNTDAPDKSFSAVSFEIKS